MGSGRDKKKKAAKRSHPEEVAKKVSGKEKTERKTQKSADKKERRKEREAQGGEDDIDAILASLALEDAKKSAVTVDADVPPPSPRCNASLTACEISPKRHELVLFGGEHYDGKKCRVYGDLYRYHIEKGVWSRVHSPGGPPARSAHVAGYWKGFVYVFGGEFTSPNQERFHHFKCLWRLDLSTNRWEELKLRGAPSPRSGHRAVMHKGRLVVFGGFFDNGKKVKYYGDTHVFDTQALTWTSVGEASGAGNAPSPRSAAGLAVHADTLLLYGGYSKSVAEDELDAERGTAHTDLWALPLSTLRWERLKRQGMPPGARAGFALTTHLKRAVLFGGVMDREVRRQAPPPQALHVPRQHTNPAQSLRACTINQHASDPQCKPQPQPQLRRQAKGGEVLISEFYNELYQLQLDSRRWFPLALRRAKVSACVSGAWVHARRAHSSASASASASAHTSLRTRARARARTHARAQPLNPPPSPSPGQGRRDGRDPRGGGGGAARARRGARRARAAQGGGQEGRADARGQGGHAHPGALQGPHGPKGERRLRARPARQRACGCECECLLTRTHAHTRAHAHILGVQDVPPRRRRVGAPVRPRERRAPPAGCPPSARAH